MGNKTGETFPAFGCAGLVRPMSRSLHQQNGQELHLVIAVQPSPGPGSHGKRCAEERHYECCGRGSWSVSSACRRQQRAGYHADGWPGKRHSLAQHQDLSVGWQACIVRPSLASQRTYQRAQHVKMPS